LVNTGPIGLDRPNAAAATGFGLLAIPDDQFHDYLD
jgi:hypothetical protein